MTFLWPEVAIAEVAQPADRAIRPVLGTVYRQVGVKLWGKGAYEREPIDGGRTQYKWLNRTGVGDIIVNKIWARNGSVSVISAGLGGCYVSGEFPLFKPISNKIDPQWFYWITRAKWFWDRCDVQSRGTSGKNRIRPEKFLAIKIPLPPVPEQRRIVAKIEELASKFNEARRLRNRASEEAESLRGSHADSVFAELDKEFGTQPLGTLCDSVTDGDHNTPVFTEDGVQFIFVGNVSKGYLHFDNTKRVNEDYFKALRPHRVPQRGDILYSAVGATLGIPAIVDTDEPFCFQRHIAILKPNRNLIDGHFMLHMLRARTVFSRAWASTTGSAQPTIPLRAIRQLAIPLPPCPEQRQIVMGLDTITAKIDSLKRLQTQTAAELDALIPSILDKAFRGEL